MQIIALFLIGLAVVTAGCGGGPMPSSPQPDQSPSGQPDLAFAEPPDLLAPDLWSPAQPDMDVCIYYSLAPINPSFKLLDGAANVRQGAVARVLAAAGVNYGCSAVADMRVSVMPGNATDFVTVVMRQWFRPSRGGFDCDVIGGDGSRIIPLSVDDGLSNLMVSVRDGAPNGTASLSFTFPPQPQGASCHQAAMIGGACQLDCQCHMSEPRARCIPTTPTQGVCAISCSDDQECPQALPYCNNTAKLAYTCTATPPMCTCGRRCLRQDCQSCVCRAPPPLLSMPCKCWRDCPPSMMYICDGKECLVPCTTLAECPAGAKTCDGACR